MEFRPVNHLAAGVIKFQPKHQVMREVLEHLAERFSGSSWGANGPLALESVMRKLCEKEGGGWWRGGGDEEGWICGDVRIFREEYFYPINWRSWETIFQTSEKAGVLAKHRQSYATHLWGHLSRGAAMGAGSAGGEIARVHCPVAAQGFMWDQLEGEEG